MKGFLLDENLPSRLGFKLDLPVFPFSKAGLHPSEHSHLEFCATA